MKWKIIIIAVTAVSLLAMVGVSVAVGSSRSNEIASVTEVRDEWASKKALAQTSLDSMEQSSKNQVAGLNTERVAKDRKALDTMLADLVSWKDAGGYETYLKEAPKRYSTSTETLSTLLPLTSYPFGVSFKEAPGFAVGEPTVIPTAIEGSTDFYSIMVPVTNNGQPVGSWQVSCGVTDTGEIVKLSGAQMA